MHLKVALCSKIAWNSEKAVLGIEPAAGIIVDFEKMFNTLSPHVSTAVALFMGLHPANVYDLMVPLLCTQGCWRLPINVAPKLFRHARELPRGMASSVLMAELAIAPLLWRIKHRYHQ